MMSSTKPTLRPSYLYYDPVVEFQYVFVWRILPLTVVTEISGLNEERDVIEHKYVDSKFNPATQMVPGRPSWDPIVLKRPLMADISLYHWYKAVDFNPFGAGAKMKAKTGGVGVSPYRASRSNCTIVAFSRDYEPTVAWNIINAWPSKITGPTFKSDGTSFAFEEVTIVHEGVFRIDVGLITGLF